MNQIINTKGCVRKETLGWLKGYLDSLVKAALLGKIKDAACIDVGEQLFQRSTTIIFMAYDCGTWTFYKHMFNCKKAEQPRYISTATINNQAAVHFHMKTPECTPYFCTDNSVKV